MAKKIVSHTELDVYKKAIELAMRLFEFSKSFPKEEIYSLTDQLRRSSRSVCSNMAEAWRKRRYEGAFVSKLNEVESEAAETQVWIEFAVRCDYLAADVAREIYAAYDAVLGTVVGMITHPDTWILTPRNN